MQPLSGTAESSVQTESLQPQWWCTLETHSPVRTHTYWGKKSMKEAFGCIMMCELLTCHKLTSLTSWIILLSENCTCKLFYFRNNYIESSDCAKCPNCNYFLLFVQWLTGMKAFPFPLPVVHLFMFKPWPAHWKANSDPGRSIILKTWQQLY